MPRHRRALEDLPPWVDMSEVPPVTCRGRKHPIDGDPVMVWVPGPGVTRLGTRAPPDQLPPIGSEGIATAVQLGFPCSRTRSQLPGKPKDHAIFLWALVRATDSPHTTTQGSPPCMRRPYPSSAREPFSSTARELSIAPILRAVGRLPKTTRGPITASSSAALRSSISRARSVWAIRLLRAGAHSRRPTDDHSRQDVAGGGRSKQPCDDGEHEYHRCRVHTAFQG